MRGSSLAFRVGILGARSAQGVKPRPLSSSLSPFHSRRVTLTVFVSLGLAVAAAASSIGMYAEVADSRVARKREEE